MEENYWENEMFPFGPHCNMNKVEQGKIHKTSVEKEEMIHLDDVLVIDFQYANHETEMIELPYLLTDLNLQN